MCQQPNYSNKIIAVAVRLTVITKNVTSSLALIRFFWSEWPNIYSRDEAQSKTYCSSAIALGFSALEI
jgi:hypothetical protein